MIKALTITTAMGMAIVSFSSGAQAAAWDSQTPVRATNGTLLSDSRGNCVRIDSQGAENECSVNQIAERAPAAAPRTVLESAERTVFFEFDSTQLTPEGRAKLDSVAQKLQNARDVRSADIVGFADRIGNVNYNKRLSESRAKVVQNYLTERGYLNTRVAEVRGVGESQSTTPCPTKANRAQEIQCLSPDRKVEVEVVYTDAQPVAAR